MQRITHTQVNFGRIGPRSLIPVVIAQPPNRATNVVAVDAVGTGKLNMLHTPNTKLIYEIHEAWARENGYREEAASDKPEALHALNTNRFGKVQASSSKLQAEVTSSKLQA